MTQVLQEAGAWTVVALLVGAAYRIQVVVQRRRRRDRVGPTMVPDSVIRAAARSTSLEDHGWGGGSWR